MHIQQLIDRFQLQPHPEGGYYRQTYRSAESIPASVLPDRFAGDRCFSTAICFLLTENNFSAFHRIKSDELWHFYAGGGLLIHVIHPDGQYEVLQLGSDMEKGESFQLWVPAGSWFASECKPGASFSFVGCTVAPGFDFNDFELAVADRLSALYPQHSNIIRRLCRQ